MNIYSLEQYFVHHPWVLVLISLWVLPWKGYALWKAAQNKSAGWFLVLLLIQTLAVLDILYIFVFSKKDPRNEELR